MLGHIARALACGVALAAAARAGAAQDSAVTLARAREAARAASPDIAAARHALDAARGHARQAGAFVNPMVMYSREHTGRSGASTTQDIVAVDQPLELPGVRAARRDAARFRAEAADARMQGVEAQVRLAVTRTFAEAVAADQRAELAAQAAREFGAALNTSERRLAEGDISGFAARRIRLEAARYAALHTVAALARASARLRLGSLTGIGVDSATGVVDPVADSALLAAVFDADSLAALARTQPDVRAAALEVEAASADLRLAAGQRLPAVTITLGSKTEAAITGERLNGLVAGVAFPMPLWDRRGGAVAARGAEARGRSAELEAERRRIDREVREAVAALRAVQDQLRALAPAVRADAPAALQSARVAYAEGELTLLEWLDTVRAWYETSATLADLRAELLARVATLERAVGTPLIQELR